MQIYTILPPQWPQIIHVKHHTTIRMARKFQLKPKEGKFWSQSKKTFYSKLSSKVSYLAKVPVFVFLQHIFFKYVKTFHSITQETQ